MDAMDDFRDLCSERLLHKSVMANHPLTGTFELLPYCNMKCRMCYIQSSAHPGRHLRSVDFWTDKITEAYQNGMLFALITGGEPLLYPGFFELYERIRKLGIYVTLNTNATLITREIAERFAENPPKIINISLYGASNETYGDLCKNPKGFDQVIQAFDLLKEYGIPFRVHSVLVPENIHDFDAMIAICNQYRVSLEMAYYMFPSYRQNLVTGIAKDRFEPEELAHIAMKYLQSRHSDPVDYIRNIDLLCRTFENPQMYSLYGKREVSCLGGVCTFWVDNQGNISGCGVHNQNKISLETTSFKDAWQQIVSSTKEIRYSEKCGTCRYRCICPVCAAANYCETGDISGTPEYLCEFAEKYAQLLKEEYKRILNE